MAALQRIRQVYDRKEAIWLKRGHEAPFFSARPEEPDAPLPQAQLSDHGPIPAQQPAPALLAHSFASISIIPPAAAPLGVDAATDTATEQEGATGDGEASDENIASASTTGATDGGGGAAAQLPNIALRANPWASQTLSRVSGQRPQAKRNDNQAGDKYEREADEAADDLLSTTPLEPASEPAIGAASDHPRFGQERALSPIASEGQRAGEPQLRSSGHPLDTSTRATMERHFGHDFGQVRLHTDNRAADSAAALAARAFTFSSHIVFGAGQYAPASPDGQRLIAHELAHVVQQSGAAAIAPSNPAQFSTVRDSGLESEAHQAAGTFAAENTAGQGPSLTRIATPAIQKWDSPEHVQLGEQPSGAQTGFITLTSHDRDLPQRHEPIEKWPKQWQREWTTEQLRAITKGLTYGEMIALSGDFYAGYPALDRAPLREIIDLIPLIRNGASTSELQSATGGRYLALAKQNESHFSNVPEGHRNIDFWRAGHIEAIKVARTGDANRAWGLNAAADHYLTDAFSGGHLRVERDKLMGSTLGNIESKIEHDLDNEYGVAVTNKRGDRWIAYGDEHLNTPANAQNHKYVEEAVRLSQRDIEAALAQRASYPMPTKDTQFAAQQLVPEPVPADAEHDRWSGRIPEMGPDGPLPNDYTAMRDRVIAHEAPGVVADMFSDDDQVRDWVQRQDGPAMQQVSVDEKIRMIKVLLESWWISDDDVKTIEGICQSVAKSEDMARIRNAITPLIVKEMSSIGQRTRVRIALDRL